MDPILEIYRQAPFAENCPPRRLLRLFSAKWITMILHSLHMMGGSSRPGALQRSLPGISKKMMTQTLRELQTKGLVARRIIQIMPPVVEYHLTPLGQRFIEPLEMIYCWGVENRALLDQLDASNVPTELPA